MKKTTADDSPASSPPITSWSTDELIGTDNRWGELWLTNLTSEASVAPNVNGNSFFAEIPVIPNQTNTIHAAIRDRAGNMGYAAKDYWVGTAGTTNAMQEYAYDAAGCLTNLSGMALDWDERYRLKNVDGASCSVAYEYDVLNRRTSRIEGSTTNCFVYDGQQIVADLDGDGDLLRTYVWGTGIDNLLCFTDHTTSNTYYAIKDHQNTVIALVDETGSVVESYEYDAYGCILDVKDASGTSIANQKSAIGNRYAFQGREIDWKTGLIYFRARWYDPTTGRWLSKDPIGISGGFNLYVFCGDNPVVYVDPLGLAEFYIHADNPDGASMGHAWFTIENDAGDRYSYGFFAEGDISAGKAWFSDGTPGSIARGTGNQGNGFQDSAGSHADTTLKTHITESQFNKVFKLVEALRNGDTDLVWSKYFNCVDFVEIFAAYASIDIGDVKNIFGISTPGRLEKWINTQNNRCAE